jgi:hypothetical protein
MYIDNREGIEAKPKQIQSTDQMMVIVHATYCCHAGTNSQLDIRQG